MLTIFVFLCFLFLHRWLAVSDVPAQIPQTLACSNSPETQALPTVVEEQCNVEEIPTIIKTVKPTAMQSSTLVSVTQVPISAINDMKTPALRKTCSSYRIQWRDAKGKNRHLSCQEMRELLQQTILGNPSVALAG